MICPPVRFTEPPSLLEPKSCRINTHTAQVEEVATVRPLPASSNSMVAEATAPHLLNKGDTVHLHLSKADTEHRHRNSKEGMARLLLVSSKADMARNSPRTVLRHNKATVDPKYTTPIPDLLLALTLSSGNGSLQWTATTVAKSTRKN